MALFTTNELTESAKRAKAKHSTYNVVNVRKALSESFRAKSATETFDIFLSHSFSDADLVLGLMNEIEGMGHSVYVDWVEDAQLDRSNVTRETAEHIRARMHQCRSLLYAFSENSGSSKWMPWELGYFDGKVGKVAVCPVTTSRQTSFSGREYLGLYPYISKEPPQGKAQPILWINSSTNVYVSFQQWLAGKEPYEHQA